MAEYTTPHDDISIQIRFLWFQPSTSDEQNKLLLKQFAVDLLKLISEKWYVVARTAASSGVLYELRREDPQS